MCQHCTITNSLIHLIFKMSLGWESNDYINSRALVNLASVLEQVGHFRNQGLSDSQKKTPQMMETDERTR